jgi:hypothetical protein
MGTVRSDEHFGQGGGDAASVGIILALSLIDPRDQGASRDRDRPSLEAISHCSYFWPPSVQKRTRACSRREALRRVAGDLRGAASGRHNGRHVGGHESPRDGQHVARHTSGIELRKARLGGHELGVVLFGVRLGGVTRVLRGVEMMRVSDLRVMRRFFVRTAIVVFRRLLVMTRRVFVVLRRFAMMVCRFLRHSSSFSGRVGAAD